MALSFLCGCSNSNTNEIDIILEETKSENVTYEGDYIADDKSKLSIINTNGKYEIVIDIIRLTLIDDGVGNIDKQNNIMSFLATDAADNPISGEIHWIDTDSVILKFTDSTWMHLPNGTEFTFKRTDKQIYEYNSTYGDTLTVTDFPYAKVTSPILDSSYSKWKAKGNVKYEVKAPDNFISYIKYTKAEDNIRYKIVDDQTYVGIQDDTIVGYVQYVGSANNSVNELIKFDEFYDNPPKIVKNKDYHLLAWQINNGYLIISTISTNNSGEWYYYHPMWFMYVNSLEQCNIEW